MTFPSPCAGCGIAVTDRTFCRICEPEQPSPVTVEPERRGRFLHLPDAAERDTPDD